MSRPGDQDQSPREDAADTQVSARRRNLLRAAVTSAPFALTLPSGAAVANTSAYQCISSSRARYNSGPQPALATASYDDEWERRIVPEYHFVLSYNDGTNDVDVTLYRYSHVSQSDYYAFTGSTLEINNIDTSGAAINASDLHSSDGIPATVTTLTFVSGPTEATSSPAPSKPVYALAAFGTDYAGGADTDADIDPIVYPETGFTQHSDILGGGEGSPTPLDGSCYCSINPCATNP